MEENHQKDSLEEEMILNHDRWCSEAEDLLPQDDGPVTGIIASLDHPLTAEEIDRYPDLRFIASGTTGLDHIDLDHTRGRGIEVLSLQGETEFLRDVHATAEHTFALILALIRKVPWAHEDVTRGNWNREAWQGTELHGKTLGIVGYGRVGRQVTKIAEGFGMTVVASDPAVGLNILPDLLYESDIVTVHVPLNDETRGMCDAGFFRAMKPTAYFVNTSRGDIVWETALLRALKRGYIRGAALDVVENAPLAMCVYRDVLQWERLGQYARTHDNLLLTPHLGGNTAESRKKTQIFMATKIRDWLEARRDVYSRTV